MTDNYCPIRLKKNICKATGDECNHIQCVERIRKYQPDAYKKKFERWEAHRRGEVRWREE